jgi:hypothetical protein
MGRASSAAHSVAGRSCSGRSFRGAGVPRCPRRAVRLAALLVPLLPTRAMASDPPQALLEALDLDMSRIHHVATPGSDPGMFGVRTALGPFHPINAPSMALLSTGLADDVESGESYDFPGAGSGKRAPVAGGPGTHPPERLRLPWVDG